MRGALQLLLVLHASATRERRLVNGGIFGGELGKPLPAPPPPPAPLPATAPPPPSPSRGKDGKILPTPVPTLKGFKKCPAGTVQRLQSATGALITGEMANVCEPCPAGRFAMFGWIKCLDCLAGRYGVGGSHSVICTQKCPGGRYGLEGSKSAMCSGACPAGRFGLSGSSNARCTAACPSGRYGFAGSASPGCEGPCPAGRFGAKTGLKECTACPLGKYQSTTGERMCHNCPHGYHTPKNDSTACAHKGVAILGMHAGHAKSSRLEGKSLSRSSRTNIQRKSGVAVRL